MYIFYSIPFKTESKSKMPFSFILCLAIINIVKVLKTHRIPWWIMNRRNFILSSAFISMALSKETYAEDTNKKNTSLSNNYRPLIHYTPPVGFMNDPNGLVLMDNEYHLFYQFNPSENKMGNVHWGHAISRDLINWKTQPVAIQNNSDGYAFSGSAVIDSSNSSKLFESQDSKLVLIYTRASSTIQRQELAISKDGGKEFTLYSKNPVLDIHSNQFRDPKVIWHKESSKWIMVVAESSAHRILFYSSDDLTSWKKISTFMPSGLLGISYECPGLLRMPVPGDDDKWILFISINPGAPEGGSTVQYFVGFFDGEKFIKEDSITRLMDFGKDFYAFQTYYGLKDSEKPIGIAWLSNWQYANQIPASPSRGMMTIPRILGMVYENGIWKLTQQFQDMGSQLSGKPLKIEKVKKSLGSLIKQELTPETATEVITKVMMVGNSVFQVKLSNNEGESLIVGVDSSQFGGFFIDRSNLKGFDSRYFVNKFSAILPVGVISTDMHIIIDNSSIELIGNGGTICGSALYYSSSPLTHIELLSEGEGCEVSDLTLRSLKAITSYSEKQIPE